MKRSEVRDMIKSAVNDIPSIGFSSGLLTFFNSKRTNKYPYAFQEIGDVDSSFPNLNLAPNNSWNITIHFADLDKVDSIPDQYELIIDSMDEKAAKLISKINQVISGYKNIVIDGGNRTPFVKKHADCLTGVILTFTLSEVDKTNNC